MNRCICKVVPRAPLLILALALLAPTYPARAALPPVAVLTQHNDQSRSGANLSETILNTSNVNVRRFGKLFTRAVDGQIYAQPLYVPRLSIPGQGTHNVVFVATMHDSVYAFDADDRAESAPLWHVQLGPSVPLPDPCFGASGSRRYADIQVEVGIVSTPVVDLASHTMYLVTTNKQTPSGHGPCDATSYGHRLHALDIATGQEKLGGPIAIQASAPGSGPDSTGGRITLNHMQQLQRPGLLLASGLVYLGFGAYGSARPYHGWLLAYNARTLTQEGVFLSTPAAEDGILYNGGIWQSGEGPAADDEGNVFITTGNGYWNLSSGGTNYADSVLKLRPALSIADWFTPHDQRMLDLSDQDLGSTGPLLIPGTHLLLQVGKTGVLYLLDQYDLGHWQPDSDSQIVQSFHATISQVHASPACWDGPRGIWCYLWGAQDVLKAFALVNGRFQVDDTGAPVPISRSTMTAPPGVPGGMLSISANATVPGTGIVWATTPIGESANWKTVPGELRAFDAGDLSHELWDSQQDAARDAVGDFAKFNAPTIADGKVYVGTFSGSLDVYGLLPAGASPVIP
jgi:hypothetical protein